MKRPSQLRETAKKRVTRGAASFVRGRGKGASSTGAKVRAGYNDLHSRGSGLYNWLERNRKAVTDSLQQRVKPSFFEDRRIGEANTTLDPEERALQRLALEHKRRHERRGAFNLPDEDEEELTHGGQLLSSLNKFDLHFADDEDADVRNASSGDGRLDASGFFVDDDDDEEENVNKTIGDKSHQAPMSLKEKMANLIAQSKIERLEKQREAEKTRNVVAEMDSVWKSRLKNEHARLRMDKMDIKSDKELQSFDLLLSELQSGVRLVPRDKSATMETDDGRKSQIDKRKKPLDKESVVRLVKRLEALRRSHVDYAVAHCARWLPPFLPTLKLCHTVLTRLSARHALARSVVAFLCECLARSHCRRLVDVPRLLVTAHLLQRHLGGVFCPELLRISADLLQVASLASPQNSPHGVVDCSLQHKSNLLLVTSPLTQEQCENNLLHLTWCEYEWRPPSSVQSCGSLQATCLHSLLALIENLVDVYDHLPVRSMCFARHNALLSQLPIDYFTPNLQDCTRSLIARLTATPHVNEAPLVRKEAPPSMLELLEPRFDEHFEPTRHKRRSAAAASGDTSRSLREAKRVQQKLRRETKATAREIRRDTAATACLKLEETKRADALRREKVKKIYSQLANQEGEYRKMKKNSAGRVAVPSS